MRSASASPTIDSIIGPAPGAALLLVFLVLLALVGLFWVGVPVWLRVVMVLLCMAGGSLSCYRLLMPPWRRIRLVGGELSLVDAAGNEWPARMIGRPFASPFYVGFRWRSPDSRQIRSLGLFRGQLSDDAHRRLVSRLRYHHNR